ncbi:MAG TPA: hypothetical protein DCZ92_09675 [Elusimicrobia bacterium]|nr:MAG: hypothetical protein A2016_10735 [Elusimicrobia bacterium GWF2_62_30]HBA61069.1 hypothetical protein [Elusimicrobiota bacterium]
MNRVITKRLIFCAALLLAAAPLRAGETAWLTSANRKHIVQLSADWLTGAAAPLRLPKGITHAFSLAPRSRAYALDIAAEDTTITTVASSEVHFIRVRKLAGNPPARRLQLPDNSLLEYFTAPAASGSAAWRAQGVLYKYVQRYYLTFSSAKGYPGDKEWEEALRLLATLDPSEPTVGAWKDDFLKRIADAGREKDPAAARGKLIMSVVNRADGSAVSFEDVEIFVCKNFVGNLYLFNQAQTAHCWIAPMEDYKFFLDKLSEKSWRYSNPVFQECPQSMRQERACDPEKLRNF